MELQDVAAVAQVVLAVCSVLVMTALAVVAYKGSRLIAGTEADRATREAWNVLNVTALSDERNLVVADQLMAHEIRSDSSPEQARRRWIGYLLLNTLATGYMTGLRGITASGRFHVELVEYQLGELLRHNPDLFEATQQGYEDEFAALARRIWSGLDANERAPAAAGPGVSGEPPL